ncbi:MAG: PAS domain-containing protein [Cytophagales bacterium]|nr:PAS domain-containing protein [Bernardetiaceae bacterium]MDW8203481.1 PAS domain-containing protein [Cytophagales bacterium]
MRATIGQENVDSFAFTHAVASFNQYEHLKNLLGPYIIDNSDAGIFAFNHRLEYTIWNRQMEKLSGLSAEFCIGKRPREIFQSASCPINYERDEAIKQRVLAGEHLSFPVQLYVYPNGERYWHEIHLSPLHDSNHHIIGGMGIVKDVTAYMQKKLELEEVFTRYEISEAFMTTAVCKGFMQGTHYLMEWVSPSFTATLGYTMEQFNMASRQNNGWIFNQAQALRYKATEQALLNNCIVKDFVMISHRNGKMMPVACYYKPLPPKPQGQAAFWLAISEVATNKENDWQIRAFFDDADNFFAIIRPKTFEVIHANPALIRYSRTSQVIGSPFMETHRRYYHREIKQALFQLNKVFDRAYVVLDMGANRAFDDRKLIWLFVQVNPNAIYAIGKMLI